jgi:AcrR family transcriptional regulator
MTPAPAAQDKRGDLTNAAQALFYEQGFGATTLANVAERAGVPLGNVYYYFKTKDSLVEAILMERRAAFDAMVAQWDAIQKPKARLEAFLDMNHSGREIVAEHGCPVGGLSMELGKEHSILGDKAAAVLARYLEWTTAQFRAMGRDDADDLGLRLMSSLQGAMLMANSFRQPELITREVNRARAWLNDL